MTANQKDPLLTYALDSSGKMVCIDNVKRGYSCNCRCPKCKKPLLAKLGHGRRQPHFAHESNSDCHGAYMSALHKLAEQIIEEEKSVMLPEYHEIDSQKLTFECVEVEQRIDRKDLQPDLVGVSADGKRWIIEIRNSHEVDEEKKSKLIESNLTCLEIDVREQTLENLRTFLLDSTERREWINNPNFELLIQENQRNRVNMLVSCLENISSVVLPYYKNIESKKIIWNKSPIIAKTDDGLYVRMEIRDLENTKYIFNIGFAKSIEYYKSVYADNEKCNELDVYADNISLESFDCVNQMSLKWRFNYLYTEQQNEKLHKYLNNPNYKIHRLEVCKDSCKYRIPGGKCIYKEDSIDNEGVMLVVCNQEKKNKDEKDYNNIHNSSNDIQNKSSVSPQASEHVSHNNKVTQINKVIKKVRLSDDEIKQLNFFYKELLKEPIFYNTFGERIKILNSEWTTDIYGCIILFQRNDNKNFFIYGVSISKGQVVCQELGTYFGKEYAQIKFSYFVHVWKDFIDLNDMFDDNPFSQKQVDLFEVIKTPPPF